MMFPGKKKHILAFVRKRFGKNPMESVDAQRCRERLEQIRILHDSTGFPVPELIELQVLIKQLQYCVSHISRIIRTDFKFFINIDKDRRRLFSLFRIG